jgi:hypothetical protein
MHDHKQQGRRSGTLCMGACKCKYNAAHYRGIWAPFGVAPPPRGEEEGLWLWLAAS